jgi:hypothetical protein
LSKMAKVDVTGILIPSIQAFFLEFDVNLSSS